MHEEEAFLDRLRDDPLDALTRSVYADWLEDRGDPRADFLRAEAAFAATPSDEAAARLDALGASIDEGWQVRAGAKWDLAVLTYPPRRKIPVIKKIRELRFMGLLAAKLLSEALPAVVLPGVPWFLASPGRRGLLDLMHTPYGREEQLDAPPIEAGIRPASEETGRPGPARAMPFYFYSNATTYLRLEEVRPEHVLEVARLLVPRLASCLFQAIDLCSGPMPATIDSPNGDACDADLLRALEGKARAVRVRTIAGDPAFEYRIVRPGRIPPEDMPRARRAAVRVLGRDYMLLAATDHDLRQENRFRRFRAEEIVARLGAVVPLEIAPDLGGS